MTFEEKKILSDTLNTSFAKWRNVNKRVDRFLLFILLFLIAFVGSALLDNWMFTEQGIGNLKYHSFDELLAINPDTVAWLTVDGTHIDLPVVQGEDNFEYLDKAFDGGFFSGGTLFLDYQNKKDFSDKYSIIHGHHMVGGGMFGDLDKFLDKQFFIENSTGTLLTPTYDYDLKIVAVGEFDAYDSKVYGVGNRIPEERVKNGCYYMRPGEMKDMSHMVALSTCSGDMSDNRIVVFCKMINKRKHE